MQSKIVNRHRPVRRLYSDGHRRRLSCTREVGNLAKDRRRPYL
jgi:hypothetical protein